MGLFLAESVEDFGGGVDSLFEEPSLEEFGVGFVGFSGFRCGARKGSVGAK